jgi:glycosyltransferase involved in cell wall biosynthesis
MLLPATLAEMEKSATIVFFLGDSPYYTPTNDYFLTLLNMADIVLVPDSFWKEQLRTIGIKNTFLFLPGIDETSYYQSSSKDLSQTINEKDIIYCGMSYYNSWGYKKALLMSKFTDFNLDIYGNRAWHRWFQFFPELSSVFHESGFIPTPHLNALFNKTKLMPVDGNPAILNGIHLRTFEALGAGVLPLIEYRKDVEEEIFTNIDIQLPIIRSYNDATALAERFLSDEKLRSETVNVMKHVILTKYSTERNAERILEFLSHSKRS